VPFAIHQVVQDLIGKTEAEMHTQKIRNKRLQNWKTFHASSLFKHFDMFLFLHS